MNEIFHCFKLMCCCTYCGVDVFCVVQPQQAAHVVVFHLTFERLAKLTSLLKMYNFVKFMIESF